MHPGSHIQLLVPPHKFGEFSELTERFDMKTEIVTQNLQEQDFLNTF